MDHTLDVTFVDSHAESDGAAQDSDSVLDELLLNVLSGCIALTSVVGARLDPVLVQKIGYLISCASLGCENEYRCKSTIRLRPQNFEQRSGLLAISSDGELKIHSGQVILGDDVIRILDVKNITNLLLSSFGRGGSKTDDSALFTKLLLDHFMQD